LFIFANVFIIKTVEKIFFKPLKRDKYRGDNKKLKLIYICGALHCIKSYNDASFVDVWTVVLPQRSVARRRRVV